MMSIIGQFLMESLIVMLWNTLLAVVITVDALAIYKLYQYFAQGTTWIVSASIYSLLMFAVCSLGLTLVFSLFFAYRATKVEIVEYLKNEMLCFTRRNNRQMGRVYFEHLKKGTIIL